MAEEAEERASGDTVSVTKPASEDIVIKVPDVELLVDGFGFMPEDAKLPRKSKQSSKSLTEQSVHDSCASSTNIDIVRRYTWVTKNRMTVQIITYGATITTIKVPDKKGVPDDVVAGFDTLEEYFQPSNPYFGATIGRYANYIREGTAVVKPSGRVYMLSQNRGHNHYNGGRVGFDKVNWRSYVNGNKVVMSHISERFNEGYPGTVMAQITFEVSCDNTIKIEMKCTTSEPTIVNLSSALYFNLAGHHAGPEQMYEHIITINADKFTPTNDEGLVTGEKNVVGGTVFDFRVPRVLRAMLPKVPMGGFDVNYCITQGTEQDLTFQARALHPVTGRVVEVYSNQPGMQFYTGNLLPDPDKIVEELEGEEEAQEEDVKEESDSESESSANGEEAVEESKKNFPISVLNPGEVYVHKIQYKFGLLLGKYV
ncbi:galactose mutarotase isoform X3 [Bicyclus anynana]|uniref:Galactose mutarotase n=1 Tax=Bicyclus anynana TaxID=110368 RepID=A0ABM3M4N9_BICAN|nr:galactose mutarotase isoform X3 [Bicyclus anynana]